MARLWSSGFELNSTTNGVEFGATTGSPTITSTAAKVRSGTYAGQVSGLVSGTQKYFQYTLAAANSNGPFFVSVYVFFDTLPSAANAIFTLTAANGTNIGTIKVDNTGAFTLFNTASQVGSASSTIATGAYHKLDIQFDATGGAGAGILNGRLDGVQFAGATNLTIGSGVQTINIGGNVGLEAQTTGTWYFDDLKLNDNTGSFENSYPGTGNIIHLRPNAAGDTNTMNITSGGTAGSTNDFTRVNEVTPDDATSYNGSRTAGQGDDMNIDDTPSSIGSSDTINCVAIGVRYACTSVTTPPVWNVRYKSTAGGTVSAGSNIQPNSLSYHTNANSDPMNYTLVLYQTPTSTTLTKANLDTAQIGYIIQSVSGTSNLRVTTIWLMVDSTPSSGPTASSDVSMWAQQTNQPTTYQTKPIIVDY